MDPHPLRATRDVIVPVLSGLIGMLVIPPVTLYLVQLAFKFTLDDRFIRAFSFSSPSFDNTELIFVSDLWRIQSFTCIQAFSQLSVSPK